MRIGIFGGSFNPIHNGHISIAKDLLKADFVEEIWFVVSPQNPFKQQYDLWPDELRLDLVRKALEDDDRLQACDVEFHLPKPSYMWTTLQELSKQYPQHEFVLLIGADNWKNFSRWYHAEDILKNHELGIYPRPGYEIDEATLPENVHFFSTGLYDISSTEIRKRIGTKSPVDDLVPNNIIEMLPK